MTKAIITLWLVLSLACVLWVGRYTIVTTSQMAYKLDRLTGKTAIIIAGYEGPVKPAPSEKGK